jgi:hypothetical protein
MLLLIVVQWGPYTVGDGAAAGETAVEDATVEDSTIVLVNCDFLPI